MRYTSSSGIEYKKLKQARAVYLLFILITMTTKPDDLFSFWEKNKNKIDMFMLMMMTP